MIGRGSTFVAEKYRVLVVEDDDDGREALCAILEALGYETLAFASGPDTLAGIADEHVDIALLDIMMPVMNGYELLEELKKLEMFEDLPVLMVTAKDQDGEILEGYQHGADYYITKPYTAKQIEYGLKLFLE
ncbi:response regulator [bacterium]|jgi:two-component system OmpR family response regulator|nr:response regulator [bacterium]